MLSPSGAKAQACSLELQRLFLSSVSRGTEWCKGWLAECVALNKWIAHIWSFFFPLFLFPPLLREVFGPASERALAEQHLRFAGFFQETWRAGTPTAKGSLNKCFWSKNPFFGGSFPARRHPHAHTATCRHRPGTARSARRTGSQKNPQKFKKYKRNVKLPLKGGKLRSSIPKRDGCPCTAAGSFLLNGEDSPTCWVRAVEPAQRPACSQP